MTKNHKFSFSFSPARLQNKAKGLKIDWSSFKKKQISDKEKLRQWKSPLIPQSPLSSKLNSLIASPKHISKHLWKVRTNFILESKPKRQNKGKKNINHILSEKIILKLIKPIIPQERKIGLLNIRNTINHNFSVNSKWTIIRDIEGYLLDSSNEFSLRMFSTHFQLKLF